MADYTLSAKVTAEISGFQKNMKSALKSLESFSKACHNIGETLQDFGDGLTGLGKKLAAIETAIGGLALSGVSECVKEFATFEDEITRVGALAKATPEEFEDISEKAKEMGATTRYTSTQAAEAMEYMAMASWDALEIMDGIAPVMHLATAAGEDLAEVSDIVTDGLTEFGMGAGEAERFTDVLAAAATSANTNVHMMGESLKYAGTIAGAMGYNIEDIAVALGLMGNSAVKSGQAGTYLRGIISELLGPSEAAAALMEEYQISLQDNEGNAKSFAEVMLNLRQAFSGMNEQEKTANANILVGQRAMTGLLAIVNASDKDFNDMTAAIANSGEACAELAAKMDDTLVGKFEILKSGISAIKNTIGEELAPTMYDLVDKAQSVVNMIQNMIDVFIAAKNQGNALDGIAEAVQALLPALQAMDDAGNLPEILQKLPGIAQKLIDKLHELSAEGKTLQDFIGIFAKIAVIAPALIAAGSGISAFGSVFSGIGNTIDGVSQAFGMFQNTMSGITQVFSKLPSQVGAVTAVFSGLAGSFGNVLKNMGNLAKSVWGIFPPLASGIEKIFSAIGRKISNLLAPIGNLITGTLSSIGGKITAIFSAIGGKITGIVSAIGGKIAGLFAPIGNFITNKFGGIASKIGGFFSSIGNVIASKLGGILTGIKTIAGNIMGAFSGVLGSIAGFAGKIAGAFGSLLTTLGKYALPFANVLMKCFGFGAIAGLVLVGLGLIQKNFGDKIDEILATVKDKAPGIIENLVAGITKSISELITFGGELIENLLDTLITLTPTLIDGGSAILISLAQGFADALPGMLKKVGELIVTIVNQLTIQLPAFLETGMNILFALVEGIAGVLPKLIPAATDMVLTLVLGLLDQLPKLIDCALDLIMALADGLLEALPVLVEKAPEIITKIANTFISKAPVIIKTGAELIRKLADGLSKAIPDLLGKIPEMLQNIKEKFLETDWSEVGKSIMTDIANGLISVANLAITVLNGLIDAANLIPGVDIPYIPEIPHFSHGVDNFQGGYAIINENNRGELVNLPDGSQVIPHDISEQYARTAARNTADMAIFIDYTALADAIATAMGNTEMRTTVELDGQKMGETLTPMINRRLARDAVLTSRT
ncbi:MAG: phage tail tape measure protein [Oscillospiraceae bacterium]|nr:phage tail tape measure protein [Oscillospiraceae bacterium]